MNNAFRLIAPIAFATVVFATHPAGAMSMQQAVAQCKEELSPQVRECVRSKMGGQRGDPSPYIPSCRAAIMGPIRACVARLIGAAGLKNNPLEAATTAPSRPSAANGAKRLAPPRTIADITAILDQEKPDPVRLKKLQTAADAAAPRQENSIAGAQFYYGRALVRAELGRFREAMLDAQKAVDIGTGKVDQLVLSTFRMVLAQQQTASGEPKQAMQTLDKMASDGEKSDKSYLFTVYRQLAFNELLLGNLDLAQAYAHKLETLARSARSIRGYDSHGDSWLANVEETKGRIAEVKATSTMR
jgi:hypothetical protein